MFTVVEFNVFGARYKVLFMPIVGNHTDKLAVHSQIDAINIKSCFYKIKGCKTNVYVYKVIFALDTCIDKPKVLILLNFLLRSSLSQFLFQ